MDEKLRGYINQPDGTPPTIAQARLAERAERDRKRMALVLLSLAGLLWTLVFYGVCFAIGRDNPAAGIALLSAMSAGYMGAGCFAGIVMKLRKVGM